MLKTVGCILIFFGSLMTFFSIISAIFAGFLALIVEGFYYLRGAERSLEDRQKVFRKLFSVFLSFFGVIIIIPAGDITAPLYQKILAGAIMIVAGVIYYTSRSFRKGSIKLLTTFCAILFLIGVIVFVGNAFSPALTPVFCHFFPVFTFSYIGNVVLGFSWGWTLVGVSLYLSSLCTIIYLHSRL